MASSGTHKGKDLHITMASPLPPHKIKSIASWGARAVFHNVEFRDWKAKSRYGMRNRVFELGFS